MLMRQQAFLMACNDAEVRVGIINQWHKTAKTKIPTLEAAFEQALNRAVKVQLDPVSAAELKAAKDRAPLSTPVSVVDDDSTSLPEPLLAKKTVSYSPPLEPESQINSPAPSFTSTQVSLPPEPIAPSYSNGAEGSDVAAHDWKEDEVTKAAKRLADFFAGQVVDLSDPVSSSSTLPSTEAAIADLQQSTSDVWVDEDPDDDVLF
jgi:DNA polymerase-3 subunit gamma/tau